MGSKFSRETNINNKAPKTVRNKTKSSLSLADLPQRHSLNKKLMENIDCPFCKKMFDSNTNFVDFNLHLKACGIEFIKSKKGGKKNCETNDKSPEITEAEVIELNKKIFESFNKYKVNKSIINKRSSKYFNDKIKDLKTELKKRKVNWQDGFCQLNLNRGNFLDESVQQINKVDLYKELHVNFIGEISNDAGGITREWFTTCFKELESEKWNLFKVSEANNFSYILNPFTKRTPENFTYFSFIGKLLAKALIDNTTINVCFNKIIYKMILEEKIELEDLIFIDTPLYHSLKNLKDLILQEKINKISGLSLSPTTPIDNRVETKGDMRENNEDDNINNITNTSNITNHTEESILEQCDLYYSIEITDKNGVVHSFDLKPNGSQIQVGEINDYIQTRINFMIGMYEPFVVKIREGLFGLIPKEKIQVFNADELELLINGRPFIDVEEWKEFSVYKSPYNANHKVIKWFWEIMAEMTQKELSNFLLFSTGTSRVPLDGFASLESNRGNVAKFTVEPVPYVKKKKNFIKAHTCFNRIDLPQFEKKEELKEALDYVSKAEIFGFGID